MGKDDPPTPPSPVAHFQYSRLPRDRLWAVLFFLTWAACIAGGIYAIQHRNAAFIHTDYTDPASCPYETHSRKLLAADLQAKHGGDFNVGEFFHLTGRWLAVSAVLALGLGAAFIHLFQHHSHVMTRVTIYSQIAIPAFFAVLTLLMGQVFFAALCAGIAMLNTYLFRLWRNQIDLATRLLGVAAHGVAANSGIVTTTILLNVASILGIVPPCVFMAFAIANGEVVPNAAREGRAECTNAEGAQVLCCKWNPNGFAQAYISLACVVVLWTMLLANQIRVFVTSGAIAQWYFAPPGLCGSSRSTTLLSMKHALGPSFGSLCMSSLVLTISQLARNALERSQREDREFNLLKALLICLAQCFWAIVEYLTKFATVMMAITGEAFLAAGRHATELLARNLLQAFASTIWFTPTVIRMACFLLSLAWALLTGGSYYLLHRHNSLEATPGLNAGIMGVAVFTLTIFILQFLGGVLLSVLDAVFICWAIDKDCQTVSHPEVYEVLQTVPLPGAVVEQPDGEILYGAGQQGGATAGQQYRPPTVAHV